MKRDPQEVQKRHEKQKIAMRVWLEGRRYWVALKAMGIVLDLEKGTRKDGYTPKFHHQLSVARLLTTLEPHLINPELTIACAFLHDILEDHGDIWTRERLEEEFGKTVADAVWRLTKKSRGLVKTPESYYGEIAKCPIASIVKPVDRAHNLITMPGVFSMEKQVCYLGELEEYYYPLIRAARRTFPHQYPAYENLKINLRCQHRLLELYHGEGLDRQV